MRSDIFKHLFEVAPACRRWGLDIRTPVLIDRLRPFYRTGVREKGNSHGHQWCATRPSPPVPTDPAWTAGAARPLLREWRTLDEVLVLFTAAWPANLPAVRPMERWTTRVAGRRPRGCTRWRIPVSATPPGDHAFTWGDEVQNTARRHVGIDLDGGRSGLGSTPTCSSHTGASRPQVGFSDYHGTPYVPTTAGRCSNRASAVVGVSGAGWAGPSKRKDRDALSVLPARGLPGRRLA